jgi:hypothetical protein
MPLTVVTFSAGRAYELWFVGIVYQSDKGLRCIRGFIPKVCPLCRKSFTIGRKLHVDAGEGTNPAPSGIDAHSSALLERIALVFDEASTAEDVTVVITEANDWIYAHSDWDDPSSVSHHRLAPCTTGLLSVFRFYSVF